MNFDQVKEYIQSIQKLLPVGTSVSLTEAEKRAGIFLEALAFVIDAKYAENKALISAQTIQSAVYSELMSKATAKTITENKITVEASSEYTLARETLEMIENNISYLKAYYDIFNNAHIFYRNLAKGENL